MPLAVDWIGRPGTTDVRVLFHDYFGTTGAVDGILLLCAGALSRRLLDARRLAAWDADWAAADRRGPAGANPGP